MNNDIRSSVNSVLPTVDRASRAMREDDTAVNTNREARNAQRSDQTRETDTRRETEATDEPRSESAVQPEREQVEQAAQELARRAEKMGRDLKFEVDDDSGMTVVKVIDRNSEEVVRQIPSEEAIARAADGSDDSLRLIEAKA
ncbi:MAG: flagellar protein FlaG [Gammaproteobacteria bacterium]